VPMAMSASVGFGGSNTVLLFANSGSAAA